MRDISHVRIFNKIEILLELLSSVRWLGDYNIYDLKYILYRCIHKEDDHIIILRFYYYIIFKKEGETATKIRSHDATILSESLNPSDSSNPILSLII